MRPYSQFTMRNIIQLVIILLLGGVTTEISAQSTATYYNVDSMGIVTVKGNTIDPSETFKNLRKAYRNGKVLAGGVSVDGRYYVVYYAQHQEYLTPVTGSFLPTTAGH